MRQVVSPHAEYVTRGPRDGRSQRHARQREACGIGRILQKRGKRVAGLLPSADEGDHVAGMQRQRQAFARCRHVEHRLVVDHRAQAITLAVIESQ
jgi:hypothetical protein